MKVDSWVYVCAFYAFTGCSYSEGSLKHPNNESDSNLKAGTNGTETKETFKTALESGRNVQEQKGPQNDATQRFVVAQKELKKNSHLLQTSGLQKPVIGNERKFIINPQDEPTNSHFMLFFIVATALICFLYLLCHNRKRILGLIVEGRQGRNRNLRYSRLKNVVVENETR